MDSNKTALITGGSSGIGLEYAREFASRGYSLAIVSNREADLAAAKESLERESGANVHTLFADLTADGCAGHILDWCDSLGLDIEVLVNNAGTPRRPGTVQRPQSHQPRHHERHCPRSGSVDALPAYRQAGDEVD